MKRDAAIGAMHANKRPDARARLNARCSNFVGVVRRHVTSRTHELDIAESQSCKTITRPRTCPVITRARPKWPQIPLLNGERLCPTSGAGGRDS